jgi:hypothetical protein
VRGILKLVIDNEEAVATADIGGFSKKILGTKGE